jgi:hypothetical protein
MTKNTNHERGDDVHAMNDDQQYPRVATVVHFRLSIGGNISRSEQQSRRRYRFSLTCARGRGTTSWQSPRGWASADGHDGDHNLREKDPRESALRTSHEAQTDAQEGEHRATRRALRRLSRPKRVLHDRDGNEEQNLKDRDGYVRFHVEETHGGSFLAA